LAGSSVAALVLVAAAAAALVLGSGGVQDIGAMVLVVLVMVLLVDLVSPGANRLHFRYRGRYAVRSWGDRRTDAGKEKARKD
jgi:hypothetical protein